MLDISSDQNLPLARRVMVTGGAGFIGSYLCARLAERGDEVLCVDNFYSGRRSMVMPLLSRTNFELVRHDVTFPFYVEVDEIYNLACPTSPALYSRDSAQSTKTCVIGAINTLGLAKRCKAIIFQASTSEVYGDPIEHPQSESYLGIVPLRGPRACYDDGKRCPETLFYNYQLLHGVDTRVGRIFLHLRPEHASVERTGRLGRACAT